MTVVTVLAVMAALLGLGVAFYGPGAHARDLHPQTRPVAEGVTDEYETQGRRAPRGMTLIEIMVVLVIPAHASAVVIAVFPSCRGRVDRTAGHREPRLGAQALQRS